MRFTEFEIHEKLQQNIKSQGFDEPTPVQAQAIPPGLQGRDIVGSAQTGTGKTLAFLLPAFQRLLDDNSKTKNPRVVVLEPTRELAIQVEGEARKLSPGTSLRSLTVYGGAGMKSQIEQLHRGVDIIVATPGRLLDHMRRGNVRFDDVQILVLDEADRMLDMGFIPDIDLIISRMPRQRQTMLYSATMPPAIASLALRYQIDPVTISLDTARPPKMLEQTLYPVPKHLKTQLLMRILQEKDVESMLVFTQTKQQAEVLSRQLAEAGFSVACLHGDFQQRDRIRALEGFRSGKHTVLVATNVAARGLDVEGISHVVNYDVPEQPDDYLHRIGRTARAEAGGDAITLVTWEDESLIFRIEHLLGRKIKRQRLEGFDYDVPTPSWAKPSAKAFMQRASRSQTLADRWRSMV
jgi:ATP-dependent RNA helicase RhlE